MMKNDYKYHVLWIDDEWQKVKQFITSFALKKIELVPYDGERMSGIDKLEQNLDYWDAIVLDARMPQQGTGKITAIGLLPAIDRIKALWKKKVIPYFVLTGEFGKEINEYDEEFADNVGGKYYQKSQGVKTLIADVISQIEDTENVIIKANYKDIIEIYPDLTELLKILKHIDPINRTNPECFNMMRKVLEWVMNLCNERGILPVKCNHTNLADCSRFLGDKNMLPYVPMYIQRSFYSCVSICNDGSHRLNVDADVKNNMAPYLIRSTIFELLNILCWTRNLPATEEKINLLKSEISKLSIDSPNKPAIYEGLVQFDGTFYYCGEYLVPTNKGKELLEKEAYIFEEDVNTSKSKEDYPKFAKKIVGK